MTDDEISRLLKPRTHWGAIIGTAIAVGGAVWGGSAWLHSRAGTDDVKALTNNSFQQRLDMEVFKGELKAINIRLERIEKATDAQQRSEERRERRGK
jgi:hypothetical protein